MLQFVIAFLFLWETKLDFLPIPLISSSFLHMLISAK